MSTRVRIANILSTLRLPRPPRATTMEIARCLSAMFGSRFHRIWKATLSEWLPRVRVAEQPLFRLTRVGTPDYA